MIHWPGGEFSVFKLKMCTTQKSLYADTQHEQYYCILFFKFYNTSYIKKFGDIEVILNTD